MLETKSIVEERNTFERENETVVWINGHLYRRMTDNECADHIWGVAEGTHAQQNMHWTAGIVRRFKHFPVVKFVLSLWRSLASRQ